MHSSAPVQPSPRPRRLLRLASLLGVLILTEACVSEPNVAGQKERFAYSWEQERQLGAEADRGLVQEMGLYRDDAVQAYVSELGQRILDHSDLRAPEAPQMYKDTKFTFRVMNSPVVNAFALPGGYVYVTRGLLAHVNNEAQLAVVIGHEIGHVAARHSSDQAEKAQYGNIGLIGATILGAIVGQKMGFDPNAVASNIAKFGGQFAGLVMLRYSREAEYEADQLGVKYGASTGYATNEGAAFFGSLERISAAEGRAIPNWAASHPNPGDRAQKIRELSAAHQRSATPEVREAEFLRRLEGLVVGDNPREGFVENNVFYHPDLRLQFPVAAGWKLQNDTSIVLQGEPNGRAVLGFQIAPGARARDAYAQFVNESKIQLLAPPAETRINGLPAIVVLGQIASEQGTAGAWSAFIEMDGKVFQFLGYCAPDTLGTYRNAFQSVASGFGPLRDNSKLEVQPARLTIVRADGNRRFSEYLPAKLPLGLTADALAIMNQVELNQPIPAGRMLKIPR